MDGPSKLTRLLTPTDGSLSLVHQAIRIIQEDPRQHFTDLKRLGQVRGKGQLGMVASPKDLETLRAPQLPTKPQPRARISTLALLPSLLWGSAELRVPPLTLHVPCGSLPSSSKQGASGTVYAATDKRTGERRALKIAPISELADLTNEIGLQSMSDHEHIVRIFEAYITTSEVGQSGGIARVVASLGMGEKREAGIEGGGLCFRVSVLQ